MKNLRRVVWSRGMFLTPQHFQTLDNFVEDTLQFRFSASHFCNRGVGVFQLDPNFIAPCLDIASSEFLMGLLRRQIEILASKGESLAARRRSAGSGLADFNTSETAAFLQLHTINSAVPELEHIWSVRRGHPETLWVTLLQLAGSLSTFSTD